MRIHEETITAIRTQAQIEEVIGTYINLKRKGRSYWACCPFHQERTPSFSVSPEGGFYKCFGCDAKGDVFSFLMTHQGMSYVDTVAFLADKYGVEVKWLGQEQGENEAHKRAEEGLYVLLSFAQKYYATQLVTPQVKTYLEDRGLEQETITRFGLGYSLPTWTGFSQFAQAAGYSPDQLAAAGLIGQQEEKSYDRFRGRLMFPLYNPSGKVVGFGGRKLGEGNPEEAKYINSPESSLYKKKDYLYGLYQAKRAIQQAGYCYLVEGYMDVLACYQAQITNTVACAGTALTATQLQRLRRYTQKISLCFDSDGAGLQAAFRAIDLALAQGYEVTVVPLPVKEDPDSYARKLGATAFKHYMEQEQKDAITFKLDYLLETHPPTPAGKLAVVNVLLSSLACIADPIKRAIYVQVCSKQVALEQALLEGALNKLLNKKQKHLHASKLALARERYQPALGGTTAQEKQLLYMLLHHGTKDIGGGLLLASYFFEELKGTNFTTPLYIKLLAAFKKEWEKAGPITGAQFLQVVTEEEVRQGAIELMANPHVLGDWEAAKQIYLPKEEELLGSIGFKLVLHFKLRIVRNLLDEIAQNLVSSSEGKEQERWLDMYLTLKDTERRLCQTLGLLPIIDC